MAKGRLDEAGYGIACTATVIDPMWLIVQFMTSPTTTGPTPSGVPVMMMSPGWRLYIDDAYSISLGTSKMRSRV